MTPPNRRPVALVTGGARRLGSAMALALARRGVDIALHYRHSEAEAQKVCREIVRLGGRCEGLKADLAQIDQIASLANLVVRRLGGLDILINNASLFFDIPFDEIDPDGWDRLLDINLKAPVFLAQAAYPDLKANRGCIVNLLDEGALRPWKSHWAYIASKAGLAAATIGLAKAYAPEVRVNAIAPGAILPPEGKDPDAARRSAEAAPLGPCPSAQPVADAAVFLALDAPYTTGEILHVDGGRRWT